MKSYLTSFIVIKAWRQLGTNLPTCLLSTHSPLSKSDRVILLLPALQWLPVALRIKALQDNTLATSIRSPHPPCHQSSGWPQGLGHGWSNPATAS